MREAEIVGLAQEPDRDTEPALRGESMSKAPFGVAVRGAGACEREIELPAKHVDRRDDVQIRAFVRQPFRLRELARCVVEFAEARERSAFHRAKRGLGDELADLTAEGERLVASIARLAASPFVEV